MVDEVSAQFLRQVVVDDLHSIDKRQVKDA